MISTLLAEPAVADPPRRVWRDWALVGVFVPATVLEGLLRDDIPWRPVTTALMAATALTLLWRRTHPLPAVVISFFVFTGLDQVALVLDRPPIEYYSSAFVLILIYSLFRWASGRHAVIGIVVGLTAAMLSLLGDWTGVGDAIGGVLVLLFPAVLGAEVRHLVGSRERDREEVKARERELLARELHDTVAHHVSAIAVRAQAGRVVGANDPAGALDALEVIEREASRTLAEMRGIVGTLRGGDDAEFAPQPGLTDLERLATSADSPKVEVIVHDRVGDPGPTVGSALYRVAQEAVTNARRHARDATTVSVCVDGGEHHVTLVVDDDGGVVAPVSAGASGFGLIGMSERAQLLGGSLDAGPRPAGGWRVEAVIPRHGMSV